MTKRNDMKEIYASLKEIDKVVEYIKQITLDSNKIFLLRGDLASGKTTLIKAFGNSLYPDEEITSPTFGLMHRYGDIYHYDLYNRSLEDLFGMGFLELLEAEGLHFVEWGGEDLEGVLRENGYNICVIELIKHENNRIYRIFNG